MPKVRLYGTVYNLLTSLAPTNEESALAQSGNTLIRRKNYLSIEVNDVARVGGLDTYNQV